MCNHSVAVQSVRREVVLPVTRERAWELITEPAELEEWLADEIELEAEPGAEVRAAWSTGEERAGVVEEVEPERRLAFRWGDDEDPSRVEFRLEDAPGGTRLVVVEQRLRPLALGARPASWGPRLQALAAVPARCAA
jgi:uncharacterized protein YndB with AHSA1/START domain